MGNTIISAGDAMRGGRQGLRLLLAFWFGVVGCTNPNIAVRPPKHPEDIVVPPDAEARFSTPPVYPESSNPNNDPSKALAGRGGGGGQPNMGAMNPTGGMGGMGRGMGMPGMGMSGMGGNGGYGR